MEKKEKQFYPPGHEFFDENYKKHPLEFFEPYADQVVAWQADGTRILAAVPSWNHLPELHEKLAELGIDPEQVILAYIPDPNIGYL